jgi:uncharacterized membrane protein YbhN (UPF0104 family)
MLRICAALAVVGFVIYRVGPAQLADELGHISFPWVLVSIAALLAGSAARIVNWCTLVRRFREPRRVTFRTMANCYFSGGLMGYTLPSTAGTDAIRSVLAMRSFGGEMAHYAAVAVTLAGMTFFSSALLGLAGIALLGPAYWHLPLVQLAAALCATMLLGLVALYLMLHFRRRTLAGLFRRMPRWSFFARRKLRRFVAALRLWDDRPGGWLGLFAGSLCASFAMMLAFAAAGRAAGTELDLAVWMLVLPMVSVAMFIPASISGFGFDQAVMIYLLEPFGVAGEIAFAVSALIALSWIAIYCTTGAIAMATRGVALRRGQDKRPASAEGAVNVAQS